MASSSNSVGVQCSVGGCQQTSYQHPARLCGTSTALMGRWTKLLLVGGPDPMSVYKKLVQSSVPSYDETSGPVDGRLPRWHSMVWSTYCSLCTCTNVSPSTSTYETVAFKYSDRRTAPTSFSYHHSTHARVSTIEKGTDRRNTTIEYYT